MKKKRRASGAEPGDEAFTTPKESKKPKKLKKSVGKAKIKPKASTILLVKKLIEFAKDPANGVLLLKGFASVPDFFNNLPSKEDAGSDDLAILQTKYFTKSDFSRELIALTRPPGSLPIRCQLLNAYIVELGRLCKFIYLLCKFITRAVTNDFQT